MSHGVIGNTSAFGADVQSSSLCGKTKINLKLNKMDKQLLQAKVDELNQTLASYEKLEQITKHDLIEANIALANVSKPIITKEIVEQIRQAVHSAVRDISFDSVDSYDVEFEIDYNNSLALSNIEFNEIDVLEEEICDHVENLFNVIED